MNKRICTHPRRQARRQRAIELKQAAAVCEEMGLGPVVRAALRGYTHTPRSER